MSPISIAGSGTITGISVGGIPDGVVDTDVLAANAVTTAKLGTAEVSGLCKAWVNFNGTSTVAIAASYNVSSITDNGVGNYTVNFTTALADLNYTTVGSCFYQGVVAAIFSVNSPPSSTSSKRIDTQNSAFSATVDVDHCCVSFFR